MRSKAASASVRRPAAAASLASPNCAGATYAASVRAHCAYICAATSASPPSSQARANASFGASSPGNCPYTLLNEEMAAAASPAAIETRPCNHTPRHSHGSLPRILSEIVEACCSWPADMAAYPDAIATPTVCSGAEDSACSRSAGSSAVTDANHDAIGSDWSTLTFGRSAQSSRSPATAGVSNKRDGVLRVTAEAEVDAVTSRRTPNS